MKELEELTWEIRECIPRLKALIVKFGPNKSVEIFDTEILLSDVLEWYDEHVEITENNGQGFYTRGFYDEFENWIEWDMSKPYLKDQSPELIKFLHSLIKTKQL